MGTQNKLVSCAIAVQETVSFYFWNELTKETCWNEPIYWKDFQSDIEVGMTSDTGTEFTVSDFHYRRTMCTDTNTNEGSNDKKDQ